MDGIKYSYRQINHFLFGRQKRITKKKAAHREKDEVMNSIKFEPKVQSL